MIGPDSPRVGVNTRHCWSASWRPVQMRPIELNGSPAVVVTTSRSHHTLGFTVADGRVSGFYLTSNPDKLRGLDPPRFAGTGHSSKR